MVSSCIEVINIENEVCKTLHIVAPLLPKDTYMFSLPLQTMPPTFDYGRAGVERSVANPENTCTASASYFG